MAGRRQNHIKVCKIINRILLQRNKQYDDLLLKNFQSKKQRHQFHDVNLLEFLYTEKMEQLKKIFQIKINLIIFSVLSKHAVPAAVKIVQAQRDIKIVYGPVGDIWVEMR